jgi:hypothetical protein
MMLGTGGSITCPYHRRHREIEPSGDDAKQLAEILLDDERQRTDLLRMAAISSSPDVVGKLAQLLEQRSLRVVECIPITSRSGGVSQAARSVDGTSAAAVLDSPPGIRDVPQLSTKTWIEIRLVDQDGKPVPNERYWMKLPDGSEQRGSLDDKGSARVEGIDPGTCMISFPDIDKREWRPF